MSKKIQRLNISTRVDIRYLALAARFLQRREVPIRSIGAILPRFLEFVMDQTQNVNLPSIDQAKEILREILGQQIPKLDEIADAVDLLPITEIQAVEDRVALEIQLDAMSLPAEPDPNNEVERLFE